MKTVTTGADASNYRRLKHTATIALDFGEPDGYAIRQVQEGMAQAIAQKILKEDNFFRTRYENTPGGVRYLHIEADCIVLTQQEFADLMREKFREGVAHSRGFMPPGPYQFRED